MAGFVGLEAVQAVRFERRDPRELDDRQAYDVWSLICSSLALDYPRGHSSSDRIKAIANAIEEKRRHLRRTLPGGAPGTKQRYAKPQSVFGFDAEDKLVLYLFAADNASSSRSSKAPGWLQIGLKLHHNRYITNRYHAFGIVAVASELHPRNQEAFPGENITVVDAAAAVSMDGKPDNQSLSGYVYSREVWLRTIYQSWGMKQKPGESIVLEELGTLNPIGQDRLSLTRGVGLARAAIIGKTDGEAAAEYALHSARLNSS